LRAIRSSARLGWAAAAVALALLAWQGHHLAHRLPEFERAIEGLGPFGPAVFCAALLLLQPLLVPDTLFALAAGAAFGVAEGSVYYFAALYVMCLETQWLGSHLLKARVLRLLAARPRLATVVRAAPKGGARFVFLVRLVPINQALVSYALGAAGVPLRAALAGNPAMFTHTFPTLYFGAAAVHITRMAGTGHRQWEIDGVLLLVGLGVCVALGLQIQRRAWAAITKQQPDSP
jgi:uncharacterized membrane protein YdjX (TVP38/TMEM64 family)